MTSPTKKHVTAKRPVTKDEWMQSREFKQIKRCRAEDVGGWMCEDCGCEDVSLEAHHLHYNRDGSLAVDANGNRVHVKPFRQVEDWGWETSDDIALLCRDCHHARHVDRNGEFWQDPEEMETYWFTYWEELECG